MEILVVPATHPGNGAEAVRRLAVPPPHYMRYGELGCKTSIGKETRLSIVADDLGHSGEATYNSELGSKGR